MSCHFTLMSPRAEIQRTPSHEHDDVCVTRLTAVRVSSDYLHIPEIFILEMSTNLRDDVIFNIIKEALKSDKCLTGGWVLESCNKTKFMP